MRPTCSGCFPATEACPGMPDVHAALFEMSEGIVDLRWLLWLEEAQREHPEARQLLSELKDILATRMGRG